MTARVSSVSPAVFVRTWQTSTSLAEVCEKLSITKSAAKTRAALYRRRGVPLRKFSHQCMPDYEALRALALSLGHAPGHPEVPTPPEVPAPYLPPDLGPAPRRKRRKRRRCSRCRKPGHTSRTCQAKRRCSICRVRGHTSRTCTSAADRFAKGLRAYRCSLCGKMGHSRQSCGR